jgi:hypothetical protein
MQFKIIETGIDKMNLYYVREKDADYGVMVAANRGRDAKSIGYKSLCSFSNDVEYCSVRVQVMRDIVVPADVVELTAFECCEYLSWLCTAWSTGGCCYTCENYKKKLESQPDEFDL